LRRFARSIEAFEGDEQGARHGLSLTLAEPVFAVCLAGLARLQVEDELPRRVVQQDGF
jgi:hypothetical protein